jgi:hypothetical protein
MKVYEGGYGLACAKVRKLIAVILIKTVTLHHAGK